MYPTQSPALGFESSKGIEYTKRKENSYLRRYKLRKRAKYTHSPYTPVPVEAADVPPRPTEDEKEDEEHNEMVDDQYPPPTPGDPLPGPGPPPPPPPPQPQEPPIQEPIGEDEGGIEDPIDIDEDKVEEADTGMDVDGTSTQNEVYPDILVHEKVTTIQEYYSTLHDLLFSTSIPVTTAVDDLGAVANDKDKNGGTEIPTPNVEPTGPVMDSTFEVINWNRTHISNTVINDTQLKDELVIGDKGMPANYDFVSYFNATPITSIETDTLTLEIEEKSYTDNVLEVIRKNSTEVLLNVSEVLQVDLEEMKDDLENLETEEQLYLLERAAVYLGLTRELIESVVQQAGTGILIALTSAGIILSGRKLAPHASRLLHRMHRRFYATLAGLGASVRLKFTTFNANLRAVTNRASTYWYRYMTRVYASLFFNEQLHRDHALQQFNLLGVNGNMRILTLESVRDRFRHLGVNNMYYIRVINELDRLEAEYIRAYTNQQYRMYQLEEHNMEFNAEAMMGEIGYIMNENNEYEVLLSPDEIEALHSLVYTIYNTLRTENPMYHEQVMNMVLRVTSAMIGNARVVVENIGIVQEIVFNLSRQSGIAAMQTLSVLYAALQNCIGIPLSLTRSIFRDMLPMLLDASKILVTGTANVVYDTLQYYRPIFVNRAGIFLQQSATVLFGAGMKGLRFTYILLGGLVGLSRDILVEAFQPITNLLNNIGAADLMRYVHQLLEHIRSNSGANITLLANIAGACIGLGIHAIMQDYFGDYVPFNIGLVLNMFTLFAPTYAAAVIVGGGVASGIAIGISVFRNKLNVFEYLQSIFNVIRSSAGLSLASGTIAMATGITPTQASLAVTGVKFLYSLLSSREYIKWVYRTYRGKEKLEEAESLRATVDALGDIIENNGMLTNSLNEQVTGIQSELKDLWENDRDNTKKIEMLEGQLALVSMRLNQVEATMKGFDDFKSQVLSDIQRVDTYIENQQLANELLATMLSYKEEINDASSVEQLFRERVMDSNLDSMSKQMLSALMTKFDTIDDRFVNHAQAIREQNVTVNQIIEEQIRANQITNQVILSQEKLRGILLDKQQQAEFEIKFITGSVFNKLISLTSKLTTYIVHILGIEDWWAIQQLAAFCKQMGELFQTITDKALQAWYALFGDYRYAARLILQLLAAAMDFVVAKFLISRLAGERLTTTLAMLAEYLRSKLSKEMYTFAKFIYELKVKPFVDYLSGTISLFYYVPNDGLGAFISSYYAYRSTQINNENIQRLTEEVKSNYGELQQEIREVDSRLQQLTVRVESTEDAIQSIQYVEPRPVQMYDPDQQTEAAMELLQRRMHTLTHTPPQPDVPELSEEKLELRNKRTAKRAIDNIRRAREKALVQDAAAADERVEPGEQKGDEGESEMDRMYNLIEKTQAELREQANKIDTLEKANKYFKKKIIESNKKSKNKAKVERPPKTIFTELSRNYWDKDTEEAKLPYVREVMSTYGVSDTVAKQIIDFDTLQVQGLAELLPEEFMLARNELVQLADTVENKLEFFIMLTRTTDDIQTISEIGEQLGLSADYLEMNLWSLMSVATSNDRYKQAYRNLRNADSDDAIKNRIDTHIERGGLPVETNENIRKKITAAMKLTDDGERVEYSTDEIQATLDLKRTRERNKEIKQQAAAMQQEIMNQKVYTADELEEQQQAQDQQRQERVQQLRGRQQQQIQLASSTENIIEQIQDVMLVNPNKVKELTNKYDQLMASEKLFNILYKPDKYGNYKKGNSMIDFKDVRVNEDSNGDLIDLTNAQVNTIFTELPPTMNNYEEYKNFIIQTPLAARQASRVMAVLLSKEGVNPNIVDEIPQSITTDGLPLSSSLFSSFQRIDGSISSSFVSSSSSELL